MFSVDNAALSYLKSRPCKFDLLLTQTPDDAPTKIRQRPLKILKDARDLGRYTHVLYWGDFLNNPVYGRGDFARDDIKYGINKNISQGYERWKTIFSAPPIDPDIKLISVGNNFQHDFDNYERDFTDVFQNLEERFATILPRDPASLKNLSRSISLERQGILKQGLDCAFLGGGLNNKIETENIFCYSFNRSKIEGTETLVSMIESRTGLKGVNVSDWLKLRRFNAAADFDRCRRIIASSKFSLSDTYHFLINSITLDIPVIGLGKKALVQTGTLGDFKKRTLFSMLGLESAYFEMEDDKTEGFFEPVSDWAQELCDGKFLIESRYKIAKDLTEKFRSDLDYAIFGRRDFENTETS
ncbi:hypothetical protein E4L95_21685 [Paracoccus liaowanqingii]|uniref:Polysaccharide pyruvyl transferase family protein n=1 Tax=Paracoccus liaowanqingii TaxID=2560053 RepID=A0A4Z1BYN7_9RHOB|nr:hypothetical protein [Paracoccus liaowanqingii]TGN39691.1 hypothetical protein E4L95_21685 [Paracoccus liaowanqingii]